MTPKGADLDATDLIEVSTIVGGSYVTKSITGQELIDAIPAPTGFVPTSRTLTINGVTQDLSADRTFTIATGLTVGTTPIASGTIGRVLFQGSGNVLQQSSSLFWDSTNERLGIGTATPTQTLDINGVSIFRDTIFVSNQGRISWGGGFFNIFADSSNGLSLHTPFGRVLSCTQTTGNVLINTTTDAGFRLDVNGTARVSGSSFLASTFLTAGGSQLGVGTSSINAYYRAGIAGNIGTTGLIVMSSDISGSGTPVYLERTASLFNVFSTLPMTFSVGSEAMRIFGTTRNVGINTTTDAGFRLDVNGTARVQGNLTLTASSQIKFNNNLRWVGPRELGTGVQIYAVNSGDVIQMTTNTEVNISSAGGITPQASSILQIESTTKGFLPPRMTTTQKNAIASPAAGLQVYDTTLNRPCFYDGTTWITL